MAGAVLRSSPALFAGETRLTDREKHFLCLCVSSKPNPCVSVNSLCPRSSKRSYLSTCERSKGVPPVASIPSYSHHQSFSAPQHPLLPVPARRPSSQISIQSILHLWSLDNMIQAPSSTTSVTRSSITSNEAYFAGLDTGEERRSPSPSPIQEFACDHEEFIDGSKSGDRVKRSPYELKLPESTALFLRAFDAAWSRVEDSARNLHHSGGKQLERMRLVSSSAAVR